MYITLANLQVCGVFRNMWRYTGEFEIGTVNHGAFTAAFLWTHQVLETLPTQTATIILLTCRAKREGKREKDQNKTKVTQEKNQENREG